MRLSDRAIVPPWARAVFLAGWAAAWVSAAGLDSRSYAWLMANSTLVAAGKVDGVSSGFLSDTRKAVSRVDGLIKGRLRQREIEISWNDKEHEEAAYRDDARVVVFAVMRKDSTFAQTSPGISCWLVEKIDLKGKPARAVEYAYPMDLISGVPASALRETEMVEKSMNFEMAKRKQWILTDNLLPPIRPLVLPKPPKAKPAAPKRAVMARSPQGKTKKTLF
jgi:hypothetical protein